MTFRVLNIFSLWHPSVYRRHVGSRKVIFSGDVFCLLLYKQRQIVRVWLFFSHDFLFAGFHTQAEAWIDIARWSIKLDFLKKQRADARQFACLSPMTVRVPVI